jgi:hypothetical protein
VSFVDHETGFQKEQASVTPVPIVIEQPPSSNVAAHTVISIKRIFGSPISFVVLLSTEYFLTRRSTVQVHVKKGSQKSSDRRKSPAYRG